MNEIPDRPEALQHGVFRSLAKDVAALVAPARIAAWLRLGADTPPDGQSCNKP
ncbi:hypothetical protein ONR57_00230 [Hoyosella sp. YIM 151337]|uniref:hypothetical protein n=1 Tax=Hoyosella sp. YIM 151337 TaxID=2992742 RepID=UPI0022360F3A|nr:hypothetical protein [Hoyosella sp. YIM 151337]MCW4351730.1 hypothetical protein [Hoyosella sp. YIM 151337]